MFKSASRRLIDPVGKSSFVMKNRPVATRTGRPNFFRSRLTNGFMNTAHHLFICSALLIGGLWSQVQAEP
ncbi:MAG: hypothetical protein WBM59_06645, partial [Sedimenticolaceae bacterium]